MGSIFSIAQIITALSFLSRITSISNSFQPKTDSSNRTSVVKLALSPPSAINKSSSIFFAIPPPVPPSVNDGLTIIGKSNLFSATSLASLRLCTS